MLVAGYSRYIQKTNSFKPRYLNLFCVREKILRKVKWSVCVCVYVTARCVRTDTDYPALEVFRHRATFEIRQA